MKVVINSCFGGFGLSGEAMKRLIALEWPGVEKHTQAEYFGEDIGRAMSDLNNREVAEAEDIGDGYKQTRFVGYLLKDGMVYHYSRDDEYRNHPALVRVVEELGDRANGRCAELRVVEVPDGADWEIDEYDGNEHIAEKHRTWR